MAATLQEDYVLAFTESQVEQLVTSIFDSVNKRIADRIIQNITEGDATHTVSSGAIATKLKNLELNISNDYTQEITNILQGYVKTEDISDVVRSTNLTTMLSDYVTLTVLNQMLTKYATTDSLADVVRTSNLDSTLGSYIEQSDLTSALAEYVKTSTMNTELAKKQDKLSGSSGQIVGFNSSGAAVAQNMPSTKPGYLHTFTAGNWVKGSLVQAADSNHPAALYDYTITIPANTHGLSGSSVTCNCSHKVNGVLCQNTFAAIGTYATIANNIITLHHTASESDAGYEGQAMLFVM